MAVPIRNDNGKHLAHAVKEQAARVETAGELVDRQKGLIDKFAKEGLETVPEINLLHDFEIELATQRMRLGRLLGSLLSN